MKKQLLCTSAIALSVAMAAPASAQEWNLDWGGFMASHLAYVSTSGSATGGTDLDGVAQFTTGELQFTPSITLDNGVTFGVNIQLEAQNNSVGGATNNVDESFIEISSDTFGKIIFGAENSAGYKSMTGAPSVTSMYINSPSFSAFVPISAGGLPFNFRQSGISTWTEVAGNNDVNRITYFTPNFNGFVAGVSYARNNKGNAAQGFAAGTTNNTALATLEDIIDFGASYHGSFGGVDVALTGRYGTANGVAVGSPDASVWGVGGQVGFGGFTVGGSYGKNKNGNGFYGANQHGFSGGATYDLPGPWAFELVGYLGTFNNVGGPGIDQNYKAYRIGASRDLGPGVDLDLYAIRAEADLDGTNAANVNGTIIGTAINLSF